MPRALECDEFRHTILVRYARLMQHIFNVVGLAGRGFRQVGERPAAGEQVIGQRGDLLPQFIA